VCVDIYKCDSYLHPPTQMHINVNMCENVNPNAIFL